MPRPIEVSICVRVSNFLNEERSFEKDVCLLRSIHQTKNKFFVSLGMTLFLGQRTVSVACLRPSAGKRLFFALDVKRALPITYRLGSLFLHAI